MMWGGKMINLSLKHRKKRVYIFGTLYLLACLFIVGQALLPGNLSSLQSNFFADIGAFFVNLFNGPVTPVELNASSLTLAGDSSLIGDKQIVIGTTTLLTYEVGYPEKNDVSDVYDTDIIFARNDHSESTDYELLLTNKGSVNSATSIMTSTIRIIGKKVGSYSLKTTIDKLEYVYDFEIVHRQIPTEFDVTSPTSVSLHETSSLSFTYKNHFAEAEANPYTNGTQNYLSRYYDQYLLSGMEENDSCYIDDYGVIHALQVGTYSNLTYGAKSLDEVTVTDSGASLGSNVSVSIEKVSGQLWNNDYDYETGLLLHASISGDTLPSDTSVTWLIDDEMKAYATPQDNNQCLIRGYRNLGEVNITAMLNINHQIKNTYIGEVTSVAPESFILKNTGLTSLEDGGYTLSLENRAALSGSFTPARTSNTALEVVDASKEGIIQVLDNGTSSLTIKALKVGTTTLTIASVAHPSLTQEMTVTVIAREVINEGNYNNYAMSTRKFLGHFSLFGFTAILGFLFFKFYLQTDSLKGDILPLVISLAFGVFFASFSEFLQLFIVNRGPSILDVGIDSFGYLAFTLATFFICALIKLLKKKRHHA